MRTIKKFFCLFPSRLGGIIFLLALILLSACAGVRPVPLDYQPLQSPEKLGKPPVDLMVGVRFRNNFEQETVSLSIGNDRFSMKVGESLSAALAEASRLSFQPPAGEVNLPHEAFLEFQLVAAIVDAPKSLMGDITGIHHIKYRFEYKAYLSDPAGKEIWRGSFAEADEVGGSSIFLSFSPEKNLGKLLSRVMQKLADNFTAEVLHNQAIADYTLATKEKRQQALAAGAGAARLGFALRPSLAPPKRIGVVDLRPVEQAGVLLTYDLSKTLRKELTSWGLLVFDPEDTRQSHPQAYAKYWACDNLKCLTQAGRTMGYDFMIYGSFMQFQERYVLTLRLLTTDPERDPQLKVVSSEGIFRPQELPSILKKLAESLLAAE